MFSSYYGFLFEQTKASLLSNIIIYLIQLKINSKALLNLSLKILLQYIIICNNFHTFYIHILTVSINIITHTFVKKKKLKKVYTIMKKF